MSQDMINPQHYKRGPIIDGRTVEAIEVIRYIRDARLANAFRYLWRISFGGKWDSREDAQKLIWYINDWLDHPVEDQDGKPAAELLVQAREWLAYLISDETDPAEDRDGKPAEPTEFSGLGAWRSPGGRTLAEWLEWQRDQASKAIDSAAMDSTADAADIAYWDGYREALQSVLNYTE